MKNLDNNFESLVKAINTIDSLHSFHKEKIIDYIRYAESLNGEEPSPQQKLSNLFYDNKNENVLYTGDLLDVKKLNEHLTAFHHNLNLYSGLDFSKKFYPYFFERYQYACVVTQDCKIAHNKVRAIEICAIKPLNAITCELLSKTQKQSRSKVLKERDVNSNEFVSKFRKLFDQQNDDSFFYHDYYENNILLRTTGIACIDIKIPIRIQADHENDNLDSIIKSKIASIKPIFRTKLNEKIARHYINVALEDNSDFFENDKNHIQWIKDKIKENFIISDENEKKQIESYIATLPKNLTIEEIWNDPKIMEEIFKINSSK
ncbi:hypothetical protein [Fluviispira sanaruensis]|uniref:Uncharacterized protein n=1 Tax=Fluviispira sanaruensis TaxID=2493639 RepID=A0A4V0P2W9_FLUSA|nr:hypothetical protein [Fluviispira sanaruensis]BBH54687.1 hypothetical protein JCM31447_31610 [Fluviispira sanaruensis]